MDSLLMEDDGTAARTREIYVTGRRVAAAVVDLTLVFFVSSLLSGNISNVSATVGASGFIGLLIGVIYFIGLEGSRGQTIGKMAAGIEVINQTTGEPPGYGKAMMRTVLRVIDGIFFYLVGFIVVLISDRRQRLGDMAAGTLVVRK